MPEPTRVLLRRGHGFIGTHLVDRLLERPEIDLTVLDKLTYAGNLDNVASHRDDDRFRFVRGDVADAASVLPLVERADRVIHAAAESHVDRSIHDATDFVRSNVLGTHVVLEACRGTGHPLLQISTDEVYGSIAEGSFSEDVPLRPNSPYAATKAAGDLLCRAYRVTYGIPVTIARGTNSFGPRQQPEKAIPTFVLAALRGLPLPVYGDGSNRREWLFVDDFARAVLKVFDAGRAGEAYNVGGGHEIANLELARTICRLAGAPESLLESVPDRPGHDFRYSLEWTKLKSLGWSPEVPFERGLETTVAWYRDRLAAEEVVRR